MVSFLIFSRGQNIFHCAESSEIFFFPDDNINWFAENGPPTSAGARGAEDWQILGVRSRRPHPSHVRLRPGGSLAGLYLVCHRVRWESGAQGRQSFISSSIYWQAPTQAQSKIYFGVCLYTTHPPPSTSLWSEFLWYPNLGSALIKTNLDNALYLSPFQIDLSTQSQSEESEELVKSLLSTSFIMYF